MSTCVAATFCAAVKAATVTGTFAQICHVDVTGTAKHTQYSIIISSCIHIRNQLTKHNMDDCKRIKADQIIVLASGKWNGTGMQRSEPIAVNVYLFTAMP